MRETVLADLRRRERDFSPAIIFDVGANVGQSAMDFRAQFPAARIHCFEPVPATFEALSAAIAGDPLTSAHHCAMGNAEGTVRVTARRTSSSNRVVLDPRRLDNTVEVPLTTGQAFCAAHGVGRIDFLKIDAEGFDLEVLRGFEPLFREGRVDCVQAECGLAPGNRVHVPFAEILAYMTGLGYGFYGLYGASRRDHLGGRVMRGLFYGNAAFVREPDGPPAGQG